MVSGDVDTTPQDHAKNKFSQFQRNNEKMRLMPHFDWIFLLSAKPLFRVRRIFQTSPKGWLFGSFCRFAIERR